ncbi:glycosyltransferase family 4 protein [Maribacter dokdonensis]|uniref:glycosyltransferase family 4 protein n=1 Tax=Maribacter dokdonensis TaxID=320912 RepID=UPI002737746C|nr:glycosyltransferase family 4 protein [Maribacter dokdonensis]MDP2527936.1 glycosyltransferase family 4 protein [Maribacter dokdonensis]
MTYNIHIITGLSGGGAEHLVLDLSQRAKKDDKKVVVISVTSLNDIEHKFTKLGISCFFLNIDSFSQLGQGLKKLKTILAPFKPKPVVHCHMFHALWVAILLKLTGFSLKIVFTLHNNIVSSLLRRWLLFLTKPLRTKDIIFSERGEKWYLKKGIVLPNGINLVKFKNNKAIITSNPKVFKFLFLASLTDQKNPLFVPELIIKLKEQGHTNFKIYFLGSGPLKESLIQKIKTLKVQDHVEIMGFRNDVPDILKDFDAQIMPSLWEGMPISILESGAVGLPVITTPVGSIPDFLNNDTGYLSNLDGFHLKMIDLMSNYQEAQQKAQKFKSKVHSEFDIDKIYERHQQLYSMC